MNKSSLSIRQFSLTRVFSLHDLVIDVLQNSEHENNYSDTMRTLNDKDCHVVRAFGINVSSPPKQAQLLR